MNDFVFNVPSDIIFGCGKLRDIGIYVSALGQNALLITGQRALRETGLLEQITESLSQHGVRMILHDMIPPEPTVDDAFRAIETCRENKCDVVVAVGGGSVIDVAKVAAALYDKPGTVKDYLGGMPLENRGASLVAAPTTAGTGSEVTPNSVLIDPDGKIKTSIRSKHLIPNCALVDPAVLITVPPSITAYSGMDALTQAIEAYVSIGSTPVTDSLAEKATFLLMNRLVDAYQHGDDLEARHDTALGSLMGGMSFGNAKLGLVHGIAHPLGFLSHLPHGLVCGLMLPMVIEFNLPVAGNKYARLSRYLNLATIDDSDDTASRKLISRINLMNRTMGLETHMRELVPDRSEWDMVISQTLASGSTKSNPREVTESDILDILERLSALID